MAKHSIKAVLLDNPLTDDPNDFSARVVSERSLSIKNICESAYTRGGADISAASMQHATESFLKEMAYLLCDGFSVNTGYFTAVPSIKGTFNSPTENFNPDKHSILFQFNQGSALRKELSTVEVEILGVIETGTEIMQITDVRTGSVNDFITPNRNIKIIGSRLKIAGDHPNVGIRFLIQDGSESYVDLDPSDIVVNNPSELIILVPDLPAGQYKLQITTQFTVGTLLKEPRVVVFDKILTV